MHHKYVVFPFTGIVGQELMKKALLINAVDPTVGGVLIKGDKGTGKSTAVRALTDLLPPLKIVRGCPFNCHPENMRLMCKACQKKYEEAGHLEWIEGRMEIIDMPLSSTEDMVVGSMDIKKALKEGIATLEPGILARANRNVLYIDEVNLLDDHLVNVLLDAAAMGVNIIEREGISLYHPARFILVGTMNPEEGELRPQILDRFGLSVEVAALGAWEDRLAVMTHRREFDIDPWKFYDRFAEHQKELCGTITRAQEKLACIEVSHEMLEMIVLITTGLNIKTHRADIVMEKTAVALAALNERQNVTGDDVKEAAMLALPHRMRQRPFEQETPLDSETLQSLMEKDPGDEVFDVDREGEVKKKYFTAGF